jgi:hydrogenase 3 maturation protease
MPLDARLLQHLRSLSPAATLIVGIGNELKGDDAAGPYLCRLLSGKIGTQVIDAGTVPENYIGPIAKKAPRNVILVDAIDFGAAPGTIALFEIDMLHSCAISTHALSLRLFVESVRSRIDADFCVIAIQPAHVRLAQPLSHKVHLALDDLAAALIDIFPPLA